jgi:hypothetical protein
MATIVTRTGKGSELTYTELDANFTNLNNGKLETPNTVAPTFTEASTPLQLNGTQPNAGGYFAHTSINSQTSRGAIGYRSNPSAGGSAKVDTHMLYFDLDDDFGLRPGGSYQGDRNIWLQANHTADSLSIYMDGFSSNSIESFDGNNGSYARTPIELHGSTTTLKASGTVALSATSSLISTNVDLDTDGNDIKLGGGTLDLEAGSITSTGGNIAFTDDMELTINSAGNFVLNLNNTNATAGGLSIDVGDASSVNHTGGDIISARRGTGSAFVEAFKVNTINSGAKSEVTMEQLGALTNQTVTAGGGTTEQGHIEVLINGVTRYIKFYS